MRFLKILALVLLAGAALAQPRTADDVYRDAQGALTRQDFVRAAAEFRGLRGDFPTSRYVADSFYWEALALQRSGNPEGALEVLDTQLREHPDASTAGQARSMRVQICGELARRGNEQCAAIVADTGRDPMPTDPDLQDAAMRALQNMRAAASAKDCDARRCSSSRIRPTRIRTSSGRHVTRCSERHAIQVTAWRSANKRSFGSASSKARRP